MIHPLHIAWMLGLASLAIHGIAKAHMLVGDNCEGDDDAD